VKVAEEALLEIVNIRIAKEQKSDELEVYYTELQAKEFKSAHASDLQAHYYHMTNIELQIKELKKEIAQILELENIKRMRLTEAMKEERIIEKLKEKKFEEYVKETDDEEMKTLDEIANDRHYKSSKTDML
jgi:flagellar FliJ protein